MLLIRWFLDRTEINEFLSSRPELLLPGSNAGYEGLKSLQDLSNLKFLFLYQTGIQAEDIDQLSKTLPGVIIDTGNYQVPILASDTTVLTLQN